MRRSCADVGMSSSSFFGVATAEGAAPGGEAAADTPAAAAASTVTGVNA